MCVLDHECFAFSCWEVFFVSLTCWLDLCLSSLLVAFIIMCFSSPWKTPFLQAQQLLNRSSTNSYLSIPLDFLSRQKLVHTRSIEISRICLDSSSTASRSIEKVSIWPIDSQQNLDPSRNFSVDRFLTTPRQIHIYQDLVLNRSR